MLEGEEEQASRLIDERDELIQLRRENMRLKIYRKAIHEMCAFRMASPTGYVMLAKQVVDWYEELNDDAIKTKLEDRYRIMKKSWIDAV
ncbi:hypothetical protein UFOVP245_20 [uncultured Caudovirales phage]|uniref:Uncharacterized protein n=1 Tax=uncultured Caudovirales phage TaxID=2100421 RepID=A0A6J7WS03_9CAUD|nr:hypothetical protein UFOVP245_20 [uncultured Caudovirales phage]